MSDEPMEWKEANPAMLEIMRLFLEKYDRLAAYDRGLYRIAIEGFVKPPIIIKPTTHSRKEQA